jgi:membrane protein
MTASAVAPDDIRARTCHGPVRRPTLPFVWRMTEEIIDRTPSRVRPGVELVLRTAEDTIHDRVPGLAAEVAFFLLLSLPPLLLLGLGAVGYIGEFDPGFAQEAEQRLLELARTVLTDDTVALLEPVVADLLREGRADIASLGVVLVLYSASRALRVIVVALTIAYDLEQTRPSWMQRIYGLVLTVGGVVLGLVVVPLLVVGPDAPELVGAIGAQLRAGSVVDTVWAIGYWPTAAAVATLLVASLYHFAAPWDTPWRRDLPGAVLAMVVWMAGSAGLRIYVSQSIIGDPVFGPLAGPLVLLLWLYVSAFAVLLGAEFNAEIEKMWPTIKPRQEAELARDQSDGGSNDTSDLVVPASHPAADRATDDARSS